MHNDNDTICTGNHGHDGNDTCNNITTGGFTMYQKKEALRTIVPWKSDSYLGTTIVLLYHFDYAITLLIIITLTKLYFAYLLLMYSKNCIVQIARYGIQL